MSELKNEVAFPTEKKEQPSLLYFVNCAKDGKQEVAKGDIKDWGDEVAEMMGKRMVTANCPKCHSTLKVKTEPSPSQPTKGNIQKNP